MGKKVERRERKEQMEHLSHKIRSMKKGHRKIAKKVRYTLELRKE